MKIEMYEIPISEVVNGYLDSDEEGVVEYSGKLNVRPAYQREFVYKDKQRDEVINTVRKGFPLNVMYWVKSGDDTFEVLDGQQRTLSICQYVNGDFSINFQYFHNLTEDEKQQILDYKLMIYICEGTDSEKLDWFKIINIAGEKLYDQELRNAIYTGPWLTDAKRHFSKNGCPAYQIANKYLNGNAIRQDYLQTALEWIGDRDGIQIEEYMAQHQHDANSNELWLYFQSVISWIEALFPKSYYRPIMKGQPWGMLYNKFKDNSYDATELEKRIKDLLLDDEVTNNKGVYQYLFTADESFLNLRTFSDKEKQLQYEKQGGHCPMCTKHFEYDQMEGDHIIPWHDGGKTEPGNLQMLCKHGNRTKSGK
jgi:hypothetical protein